jgi:hypothetical protein
MKEYEEDSYSDAVTTEEEAEEDTDGEISGSEAGFLRGYEEDMKDPNEEVAAEQEELEY